MFSFFSNPWVIGIISGVPSGILVTWITRLIFNKRDNKEYYQKVIQANREVIYAIRPTISENEIPDVKIVESLIRSNSLKYGIDKSSMYSIEQICDDLIREVMDSSFISSNIKTNYCKQLIDLKEEYANVDIEVFAENKKELVNANRELDYRKKNTAFITTTLGLMTSIMIMITTIDGNLMKNSSFFKYDSSLRFLTPMLLTLTVPLILILLMIFLTILKKVVDKERKTENFKKDKEK